MFKIRSLALVAALAVAASTPATLHPYGTRHDYNRAQGTVAAEFGSQIRIWRYYAAQRDWSWTTSFTGYQCRWSPNGRYLAYNVGGNADVYLYDTGAVTHRLILANNGFSNNVYCWKDNQTIVCNRTISGVPYATSVNINTGQQIPWFWAQGANGADRADWTVHLIVTGTVAFNGVYGYGLWSYGQLFDASPAMMTQPRVEPGVARRRVAYSTWTPFGQRCLIRDLDTRETKTVYAPDGLPAKEVSFARTGVGYVVNQQGYGFFVHGL